MDAKEALACEVCDGQPAHVQRHWTGSGGTVSPHLSKEMPHPLESCDAVRIVSSIKLIRPAPSPHHLASPPSSPSQPLPPCPPSTSCPPSLPFRVSLHMSPPCIPGLPPSLLPSPTPSFTPSLARSLAPALARPLAPSPTSIHPLSPLFTLLSQTPLPGAADERQIRTLLPRLLCPRGGPDVQEIESSPPRARNRQQCLPLLAPLARGEERGGGDLRWPLVPHPRPPSLLPHEAWGEGGRGRRERGRDGWRWAEKLPSQTDK